MQLITNPHDEITDSETTVICAGYWPHFLNEKNSKKEIIFATPDRVSIETKQFSAQEVFRLQTLILPVLAETLNEIHQTKYEDRYWDILLSPWLKSAISNIYNRGRLFQEIFSKYDISSGGQYLHQASNYVPEDTADFFSNLLKSSWMKNRDHRITQFLNFGADLIEPPVNSYPVSDFTDSKTGGLKVKNAIKKITERVGHLNSGYFQQTYMPTFTDVKVQIMLGQFPIFQSAKNLRAHYLNTKPTDDFARKLLILRCGSLGTDQLTSLVIRETCALFPKVFLEYYDQCEEIIKKSFPKTVKYIFTSNSFYQDDLFKVWTSKRVVNGTKYLVGQHGNNYGANSLLSPTNEEKNCDTFISWGWTSNDIECVPAICFTRAGLRQRSNNRGGLLILTTSPSIENNPWDETREYFDQLEQQHQFFNNLVVPIQSATTVRVPLLNSRVCDHMPNRWTSESGIYSLDIGGEAYFRIRPEFRLAVFSYDSTGLLEGLASNVPTMAFWLDGLDHLNDFARAKYQILVDAGIVFLDSTDCATMVNEVWDDVDGWWMSAKIQKARENFCANFCEYSEKPARDIAKAIRRAIAS